MRWPGNHPWRARWGAGCLLHSTMFSLTVRAAGGFHTQRVFREGILPVQVAKGHRYKNHTHRSFWDCYWAPALSTATSPTSMQGSNAALGFSILSCQGLCGLYVKGKEWFCHPEWCLLPAPALESIMKVGELLEGQNVMEGINFFFLLLNVLC